MLSLITLAILVLSSVNQPEPGHCQHAGGWAPRRRVSRPWRESCTAITAFPLHLEGDFHIRRGKAAVGQIYTQNPATFSPLQAQHGAAAQRSLEKVLGGEEGPRWHSVGPGGDSQATCHPAPQGLGDASSVGQDRQFLCRANPFLASRMISCTSPPSGAAPHTEVTSSLLSVVAAAFSASSQRSVAQLSGTSGGERKQSALHLCTASRGQDHVGGWNGACMVLPTRMQLLRCQGDPGPGDTPLRAVTLLERQAGGPEPSSLTLGRGW